MFLCGFRNGSVSSGCTSVHSVPLESVFESNVCTSVLTSTLSKHLIVFFSYCSILWGIFRINWWKSELNSHFIILFCFFLLRLCKLHYGRTQMVQHRNIHDRHTIQIFMKFQTHNCYRRCCKKLEESVEIRNSKWKCKLVKMSRLLKNYSSS